ncbi:hypothetical protein GSI_02653 [Ganoderma sinense ZZ0214-1]|uniref:F-box domain-containing protein n=1 Tax=Ganoderma sinense ZZ0214-1 TaxID=1077348 RepID=A0A2G8SM70_9APHY|nr:hypothetical protein GSI_02653 [Ganoderma sinense ZZ0214-1]
MVQLPPEVYSVIASYVHSRDLLRLARTTKALQRAAEPRIYENVVLRDAQSAYLGCHSITMRDGLRAPYVKRFVLYEDPRRSSPRNNFSAVSAQFWLIIQLALTMTVNLDSLVFWDPLSAHSWILNHEQIRFQLREANLRLPWDAHLVEFLQKQDKLQALNASDSAEDGPLCPLPPTALGALESFSGSVLVVAELLGCPLTRLQIVLDDDTAPILPTVVGDLGKIMRGLRSLSMVNLPGSLLLETVQLVATSVFASTLRYLGVLPLSCTEPDALNGCLMNMHALEVLEVDVTRWEPQPPEWMHRPILLGFHMFAPSLNQVVFWVGSARVLWYLPHDGDWQRVRSAGRAPGNDILWRSF